MAKAEEDAFLNGNGTGKPTGIFDATHGEHLLNTLSAGIKSDDMLDLVYGLKRPYRKGASFIMNDGTLAQKTERQQWCLHLAAILSGRGAGSCAWL